MIPALFTKPIVDEDDWRKFTMWELMDFDRRPFCVYHPGEPRNRTTLEASRRLEDLFFKETYPWATYVDRRTLGIDALFKKARGISDNTDPIQ